MVAPYITPDVLMRQPAGLSWQVVPTLTAETPEQKAQLALVCQQVTSLVDGYLNQPLRAECVTEEARWPGQPRVSVDRHSGIGQIVTRRWPVTAVNAVQVSPARAFPPSWTLAKAAQARIAVPVLMPASGSPVTGPSGGNRIDLAPGVLQDGPGRQQQLVSWSYTSGYPHTILTQSVQPQGDSLDVGDVTGWDGWTGFLLDGPATEFVSVTSATAAVPVQLPGAGGTVDAGPGTLTLAGPLAYGHGKGALLTAVPLAALHAAALKCAVVALETIAAIAVQSSGGQLPGGLGALAYESELALDPFARVALGGAEAALRHGRRERLGPGRGAALHEQAPGRAPRHHGERLR